MRCKKVQRSLSAYVDGELAPGVRGELEAHMDSCARCAQQLERIRALAAALDTVPGASVPFGFAGRVRARADRVRMPRSN